MHGSSGLSHKAADQVSAIGAIRKRRGRRRIAQNNSTADSMHTGCVL
jgi:hypothetical protein